MTKQAQWYRRRLETAIDREYEADGPHVPFLGWDAMLGDLAAQARQPKLNGRTGRPMRVVGDRYYGRLTIRQREDPPPHGYPERG